METEEFKAKMTAFRNELKTLIAQAVEVKESVLSNPQVEGQSKGEMVANMILAYRHLEDAAMRFGKAIQAASGGESPLGGPDTPANANIAPAV